MNDQPILYAEDEENDILFMERAFHFAEVTNPLVTVPNGELAIDYLASLREQSPSLFPRMALLDLNLPLKSGLEVLKWIRGHPLFCTLPVLVISSSDQDSDIHRAYLHGVNGYLVKPSNPRELQSMVKALKDYWLTYNHATAVRGVSAMFSAPYKTGARLNLVFDSNPLKLGLETETCPGAENGHSSCSAVRFSNGL